MPRARSTAASAINDTTTSTPPVGTLGFGVGVSSSSATGSPLIDVWMDDLVVSASAIGCN